MKSHSCANHTPSGYASTDSSHAGLSDQPVPPDPLQAQPKPAFRYCAHVTSAGRRCRMLAMIDSELCDHHHKLRQKRLHQQLAGGQPSPENPMTGLLARIPRFEDPASVHHFIGDVVKQFAAKQISRHDALAMGYLCQLLLTSFADHRKSRARQ